MPFIIKKISDSPNHYNSSIMNFLKQAVRPEEEMMNVPDDSGQQQSVTDLEYLERNYPGDVNAPFIDGVDFSVGEILAEFASVFGSVVVNVNQVKSEILQLINILKQKKGIKWEELDAGTKKLFEKSFNLEQKSLAFRNVEVFPFNSQERDLMDDIGDTVFSSLSVQINPDETQNYELTSYEYGGVSGYGPVQLLVKRLLGQKLFEISEQIMSQDISIEEKKQQFETVKNELKQKERSLYSYLEDYGGDVMGLDIELLDDLAVDFSKPGLLSRGDLDTMIFSLESLLNTSAQMAGKSPAHDPYRSERFYDDAVDEGDVSPAPGQEVRYQTEKEMQLGWSNLIESFSLNEDSMREVQAFLSNYNLSIQDVLEAPLSDFDSKNPMPSPENTNLYNNWVRRKFIEFVKASKSYSEGVSGRMFGGPEFNIFSEDIADSMIAINSGIMKTNEIGISNIDFSFDNPYRSFNGLSKFVQSFMGNIDDVFKKFNISPNQDFSSNAERIRIKEITNLLVELNFSANRIYSASQTGEKSATLPQEIVSLRDNAEKFFTEYDKYIGIRPSMNLEQKQKKYLDVGAPISFEDLMNLNGSISSYDGSVALSLLNRLNSSAEKVTRILGTLRARSSRKQEKEQIIRLKESAVNLRTHLKNMGLQSSDLNQLKDYLDNFSSNMQEAASSIVIMFGNSSTASKLNNSMKNIVLILNQGLEAKTEGSGYFSDALKRLSLVINLLKDASDEQLGIAESALNSEEEMQFKQIQIAIKEYYDEILQISSSEEEDKSNRVKEIGEQIVSLAKESLPLLEGMLTDFLNIDSSEKMANVAYREMQVVADDLPNLFFSYGDYKINIASDEAEAEYEEMTTESKEKDVKRKIKTEFSFDPDNQTITFHDIKRSKSGTIRDSRTYEIGDSRLERGLVSRKLIKLQPDANSNFMRAFYEDTYIDPRDLIKTTDDKYQVSVVYNVPQNPSVLNRIVSDLREGFNGGTINSSKDVRQKLSEVADDYKNDKTFGNQVSSFIQGLLNSNEETETISRDLFDSLVISEIENNFVQYSQMLGNPFMGVDNLDRAIDRAIQMGRGNPKYNRQVEVLNRMKEDPRLKQKLIDYHLKGNVFSTDISREKKQQNTAYEKLISIFPEVSKQIDISMQYLPDEFVYDPEFVKLVSDAINAKKSESNARNSVSLERAKADTQNRIETLIGYVNQATQEDKKSSDEDFEYDPYEENQEDYDDTGRPEDEEAWQGESFEKSRSDVDLESFNERYDSFLSSVYKELKKDNTFSQYINDPDSASLFVESVADSISEDMLNEIRSMEDYGYSLDKLTEDIIKKFRKKKLAFNINKLKKHSSKGNVVFNLKNIKRR